MAGPRRGPRHLGYVPPVRAIAEALGASGLAVVAGAVPVDYHDRLVADHPGVMSGRERRNVAGTRVKLRPVCHLDPQHARSVVLKVRRLAQLGSRDRLDVHRPAPARLARQAPDGSAADAHEIDATFLDHPFLVRGSECLVLRQNCRWHRMPPCNVALSERLGTHAERRRLQDPCSAGSAVRRRSAPSCNQPRSRQNSLPSGSASTTHPPGSSSRLSSTMVAPRARNRSISLACSPSAGSWSRCTRFFTAFRSGTVTKTSRGK